jgi:3-dehydroquinate synthetase
MAMKLSVLLNKTKVFNFNLIKSHLNKLTLPISLKGLNSKKKWNIKSLIRNMQNDKKRVDKNIKFILLNDIGKAYIEDTVSHDKINLTIQEFLNG